MQFGQAAGLMNIWMLTTELPRPLCGGIARYTDEMASALTAAGHAVSVIGLASEADDRVVSGGYRLRALAARETELRKNPETGETESVACWPYNSLNRDLAVAWEIAERVGELAATEGCPDIIEVPEYKAFGVFLKQRQLTDPDFLPGVPVVVMLHTPDFVVRRYNQEPSYTLPDYWVGQQEKAAIVAADARCAPSHFIADAIPRLLEEPDLEIDVAPLPLRVPESLPGAVVIDPAEVLFFGRLEARKGVLELLQAMERRWKRGADTRLTLLGPSIPFPPKGEDMSRFLERRYAHRLREGKLLIIPGLDHDRALDRIRRAAVVVIPSLWENFPYACLEAMAMGQVVVASEHGGMREMIGTDESAGFLFSWEQPETFDRQLGRALSLDLRERAAMGKLAHARVRQLCNPLDVAAARLACYERVIESVARPKQFPFPATAMPCAPHLAAPPVGTVSGMVSVVIPFFNLGTYLKEALESVLASDYPLLEVIIVNDGSDESASLEVLAEIEALADHRVQVVHQENQGLSATRNAGAEIARGEFVAFVDADDAVEPTFLRRAVWVMQQYANVHIVSAWVRFFGSSQGTWTSWNLEFPYLLAHNLMIPICLVRRESFLRFGRNTPEMAYGLEDFEGWISMLAKGCGGVAIPEVLARYRVRHESMFQSINRQQQMFLYRVLVERHPELYRRYGVELFQLLFANGPAHDMDQPTMWGPPYDILRERLLEPLFEERKKTAEQWRETVELRGKLHNALLQAEFQWREGCELRERLAALDAEKQEVEQRFRQLSEKLTMMEGANPFSD